MKNFQIKHIDILDAHGNQPNAIVLHNFFLTQQKLESFSYSELSTNHINVPFNCTDNDFSYNFKLKKLSFMVMSNFKENIDLERNFLKFLKNQSSNVLDVRIFDKIPMPIYKYVVSNNFVNLNTLEILASNVPQEKSFYANLKFSSNLKILRIGSTITRDNIYGIKELFRLHCNIEKLLLNDSDEFIVNDLFFEMSSLLKKLTHLEIFKLQLNFRALATIKSLKHFSIKVPNDIEQWLRFILLHENLESISVMWFQRDFDANVITQIINRSGKIKHMTLGGRFIACKKIYDAIKHDYKNLRSLKMHVHNYDEVKCLNFTFPADKSSFNAKCEYFEENNDREPLND